MSKLRMLKFVIREYGVGWLINRCLYLTKLKMIRTIPSAEAFFEKKTEYPERINLFQIDVNDLRELLKGLSEGNQKDLIQTADDICNGVIKGFSSFRINYGNPIDWQLNPFTGERCNEKQQWYKIPDFDNKLGDIKMIWEVSRFSHFITLARAHLLTSDYKYYDAFSKQLDSWLKDNTYGLGANFKCGQECAIRMVNALLAYAVFDNVGIATDSDRSNLKDLVDRCYRRILSNFFYAYKCIENNHTISELTGLIIGAWCCRNEKRLTKAFRLLDVVVDAQFDCDGGYRQFSFNYQRLVLQNLECVLSIERFVGKELSTNSKEKIRRSALLMYQCQNETGDMPNYGHNDGALIFPVTSCGYRDFRPTINAIHALITGNQIFASGKHQEEFIWFSGGRNPSEYPYKSVKRESTRFLDAGLFIQRKKNAWSMVILNDYKSRPAHMDQLHFDLWINGVNVLCDAGTYSYADRSRKAFLENIGHNTVVVKGKKQMDIKWPFMIYNWTKRIVELVDDDLFEGTMISNNGYIHRRRIEWLSSGYRIFDLVDNDYTILFHTPCDVIIENGKAILTHDGKMLCIISCDCCISVKKTKRSLYYMQEDDTNCLLVSGKANQIISTDIKLV